MYSKCACARLVCEKVVGPKPDQPDRWKWQICERFLLIPEYVLSRGERIFFFFFLHIDSLLTIGEILCQKFCVSAFQLMDTAIATAEFCSQAPAQLCFCCCCKKSYSWYFCNSIFVILWCAISHDITLVFLACMGPGISKATLLLTEWPSHDHMFVKICHSCSITQSLAIWRGALGGPVTSKIAKLMRMSRLIFIWWLFTWLDNCLNMVMSSLANHPGMTSLR